MSVGNFTLYGSAKLALLNGGLDLATNAIACALLGSGYTPSAAHDTWSDVSANEIADAGYAEKVLSGQTVSGSSGTVTVDSGDISFGAAVTLTAKYIVFVKGTAGSLVAGNTLVGYCDLNTASGTATVSSTNGTFAVNTPSGLFTMA